MCTVLRLQDHHVQQQNKCLTCPLLPSNPRETCVLRRGPYMYGCTLVAAYAPSLLYRCRDQTHSADVYLRTGWDLYCQHDLHTVLLLGLYRLRVSRLLWRHVIPRLQGGLRLQLNLQEPDAERAHTLAISWCDDTQYKKAGHHDDHSLILPVLIAFSRLLL